MIANLFGILMCVGFVSCYIPQIVKLYRTKSSNDISVGQYYLTIVGYLGALFYMLALKMIGLWLILNYVSGIAFCIWIILLCRKYKKCSFSPSDYENTLCEKCGNLESEHKK